MGGSLMAHVRALSLKGWLYVRYDSVNPKPLRLLWSPERKSLFGGCQRGCPRQVL